MTGDGARRPGCPGGGSGAGRHHSDHGPVNHPAGAPHSPLTYRRVPFELPGDAALRRLPDPPSIEWRTAYDERELIRVIVAVLATSPDARDRAAIDRHGAVRVAEPMVRDATDDRRYEYDRDWWAVLIADGAPAGFVLPVVFAGRRRGGLDEGTVHHIGVMPERRGRGLGDVLLARGTDALLDHGVWRITADTAAENDPMIRRFERQGWTRLPEIRVGAHPLPGLD